MTTAALNDYIRAEAARLAGTQLDQTALEAFASFVIENYRKRSKKSTTSRTPQTKIKALTLAQLKAAVYHHFSVATTAQLRKSPAFQMATSGIESLDLTKKEGWETLYRRFVDILPNEKGETGYGCINGINIFKYDKPWQIFDLDPKTASDEDIKRAYFKLSKIYHPDNPGSGDERVFNRLKVFYESLTAKF